MVITRSAESSSAAAVTHGSPPSTVKNNLQNGAAATTTMAPPPVSVLFVCLGNICRSPMAEAVFRSLTSSHPLIKEIDSAGTGAYHTGDGPDPRTMDTLKNHDIIDYSHAARKVRVADFHTFDYILAMDQENLYDLQRLKGRVAAKGGGETEMGKVMLFGDFGGKKGEVVVDPYYGARNGFEVAYEQMVRFSKGFVAEVLGKG